MRRVARVAWVCAASAAASVGTLEACWYDVPDLAAADSGPDVLSDVDAEAGVVDSGGCDPDAAFAAAVPVPGLSTTGYDERFARFTADELTAYFAISPAAQNAFQLMRASRPSLTASFGTPSVLVPAPSLPASDNSVTVTATGLVALLASTRPNYDTDASQIWSASRGDLDAAFGNLAWSTPTNGEHNGDLDPYFVDDHLYYAAYVGSAGASIDVGARFFPWGSDASEPSTDTLNSAADDRAPVLTSDDTRIFLASKRGVDGGPASTSFTVWTSVRNASSLPFPTPTNVAELNGLADPRPSWISPDGCRLYLTVQNNGSDDVFVATRGK